MFPATSTRELAARAEPIDVRAPWRAPSPRTLLALAIALFVLAALPLCADLSRYHGDERFYTDAALEMAQSGDWWSPHFADGSARWNKPLFAYWMVAACGELLGFGPLSARLPFLLAAALSLWATARVARILFASAEVALFAALMFGSSAEFLMLATRSTPDAPLLLGASLALAGAAELCFAAAPARAAAWLFFGGAGLALASKGALGLLVLAFGIAWIASRRRSRARALLLRPGPIALFALLGALNVAPLFFNGGAQGATSVFEDQLGARQAHSAGMVLSNLASYLGSLVRHFLPWSALALGAVVLSRERVRKWARERRAPLLFAASWYLVLLCVFSAANIQRGRYLVPAYPLVAAACASLLVFVFDAGRRSAVARALALALALLASVVAVALVAIGWRTEESSFSGWAACACALGGLVLVLRAPRERAVLAAAGLLLVVIPLGERGSREIFDASAAPALIARLETLGARGADVACVGGEAALASQLRLQTGGRLDPSWTREPHVPLPPQARFVIVAPEIEAPKLAVSAREDCGFEYRRLGSAEIARVALARDARAELVARRRPFQLLQLDARPPRPALPDGER